MYDTCEKKILLVRINVVILFATHIHIEHANFSYDSCAGRCRCRHRTATIPANHYTQTHKHSRRPCAMSDLENISLSISLFGALACLLAVMSIYAVVCCVVLYVPITDVLFVSSHTLIAHISPTVNTEKKEKNVQMKRTKIQNEPDKQNVYFDVPKHFKISP